MSGFDPKEIEYTNFGVLTGVRGCGKSTVLKQLAEAHAKGGGRVLVLPSDPADKMFKKVPSLSSPEEAATFTGVKKIQLYDQAEFEYIAPMLNNCMVVSDDVRNYVNSTLSKPIRKFLIGLRHNSVHLYVAGHSLTQIPPEMFNWVNLYFFFQTEDHPKRHGQKFGNMDKLVEIFDRVNAQAKGNRYYYEIHKSIN